MVSVEWWVVFATLAGPVLAVQTQKFIERAGERRRARLQIFSVLMATRATRMSYDHVQALNRIELEFRGRKYKRVIEAWRVYADKLNEGGGETEALLAAWAQSRDALFYDLMFCMSQSLGYKFDRVQIMRGVYYPRGHGEDQRRQDQILSGLEAVLSGNNAIPMKIIEVPSSPEQIALQVALTEKMTTAYGDDGALRVRMISDEKLSDRKRG